MTPVDPKSLSLLRQFDTPTVLNVIELFDVRPRNQGFTGAEIRAVFPEMPPIVGYASTATFQSAEEPRSGNVYAGIVDQIAILEKELPRPRIVVFQDIDARPVGATFGEVMCTAYKAFGCAGLVTSGAARDLDQVRRLGFPCWSASVISSHAYCRIVGVHIPVVVGGLAVVPGDLLHADANGVALIPAEIAREVAIGCELFADAENEILGYARGARPAVDGLRQAQQRCRAEMAEIPRRAREAAARG